MPDFDGIKLSDEALQELINRLAEDVLDDNLPLREHLEEKDAIAMVAVMYSILRAAYEPDGAVNLMLTVDEKGFAVAVTIVTLREAEGHQRGDDLIMELMGTIQLMDADSALKRARVKVGYTNIYPSQIAATMIRDYGLDIVGGVPESYSPSDGEEEGAEFPDSLMISPSTDSVN